MKLEKIVVEGKNPASEFYDIMEISLDDIEAPTANFLNFVRKHKDYSFLNIFTIDEFKKQVWRRFASH